MIKNYGRGEAYTKRTPSMYAFYHRELTNAQCLDDEKAIEKILADVPKDIYLALEKAGVIETSVEKSREVIRSTEVIKATIIVLNQTGYLADMAWPSNSEQERIVEKVNEIINEELDGQPDWQQEWEDFGEVYDDDPEGI